MLFYCQLRRYLDTDTPIPQIASQAFLAWQLVDSRKYGKWVALDVARQMNVVSTLHVNLHHRFLGGPRSQILA